MEKGDSTFVASGVFRGALRLPPFNQP